MWCEQCRQDVPAVASGDGGRFCCPRCGRDLSPGGGRKTTPDEDSAVLATDPEPPLDDGWELDQQLRHIEHVLGMDKSGYGCRKAAYRQEAARLDPPNAGPPGWHLPSAGKPVRAKRPQPQRSNPLLAGLTWIALSLGTMAFVCGGVLLGWSLWGDRPELWNVGMPVALCGQIALLVGLVLQLDRLWHDSRHAAAKLDQVDEQLHELKTTTTLLGTGHNSPGSAFYSHLAGGAGPELLLSDLKGQLDLLALKIMQDGR